MPQSRTSSIRYASRIGIGALTLALGSATLTAPAASATSGDTATVTTQPSASASTDASTATSSPTTKLLSMLKLTLARACTLKLLKKMVC